MTGHIARGPVLPSRAGDPELISQALLRAARENPAAGVGVAGDGASPRFIPYPELLTRAGTVWAGLAGAGVTTGDTVLLQLARIDDFLTGLWGCLLGGARPVAAAVPQRVREAEPAVAKLCDAWLRLGRPAVLADDASRASLLALPADHPLRQARLLPYPAGSRVAVAAAPADPPGEPADVAMYLLSSGSTGRPKVIPLTHRGLVQLGIAGREQMRVSPTSTAFSWMPIDHSGALLLYHLVPVFATASNWHVPTDWVLSEPVRWIEALDRHRATHTWAPTFGFRLVTGALRAAGTEPGRHDLSQVTGFLCGGEQILYPVILDFLAATASFGTRLGMIQPAWGMTETCSGITFGWLDHPEALQEVNGREYVTVGTPSPGAELRVVDAAGEPLPEGHSGRLHIRTARLTPGYLDDPEANAAFVGEGWFDTGDLAQLHGDRLTIIGRAKELIILNGENYSCHEIEQVASTAAGVRTDRIAAVGLPDQQRGSEVLAIGFVPLPGAVAGEAASAIAAVLAERLGLTPAVTLPLPAEEFPLTANGKVRRGELRDRLLRSGRATAAGPTRPGARPVGTGALRERIAATFQQVLGQPVDPARPLYEQGVDSVKLPQLALALQRSLDRQVTTLTLLELATVDALAAQLASEPAHTSGVRERPESPGQPHVRPPEVRPPAAPAGAQAAAQAAAGAQAAAPPLAPLPASAAGPPPVLPPGLPPADRRVAVIGLAGRFPGADSVAAFWDNLCRGVDSVRRLRPEQLTAAGIPAWVWKDPAYVPVSGLLGSGDPEQAIASFAADLFGISAREAATTDPQQRLFLECCHEVLEQAGYAGGGGRIGVFAGSGMNLYSYRTYLRELEHELADPAAALQAAMGNQPDFLATRAAYRLDLTGPAVNVQTACSTGLVAVHLAIQSLLAGDCDLALAGAAAIHVPQLTGYTYVDGSILSRAGQCRPFDAAADGTVGGNGVAAVALKRLDRALADRDTIHAVILGSAINNDGAGKVSFSAPSVTGQVAAITAALDAAGVGSGEIGYVEAHGTGTRLGDPMEVRALTEAFSARAGNGTPGRCALGSVKANIGHLDSCAGMAGLVKAVAAVRSGRVPPQIHFDQLNPQIALDGTRFFIPVAETDWPAGPRRLASVQALGVGGTNAHLVLEAPPPRPAPPDPGADRPGLVLSAQTGAALAELAGAVAARLRAADPPAPADLLTTTALGRPHRRHRLVAWGVDAAALATALESGGANLVRGDSAAGPGRLVFAFSGQGQALAGSAAELYHAHPRFQEVVDCCAARFRDRFGGELLPALLDAAREPGDTDLGQPALFTYQVALVETLAAYGVRPDAVAGHSLGEYAAWCAAGGLSIEDGFDLTAERGRQMRELTGPGAMVAVRAGRPAVEAICAVVGGLELAVVNGARDHVLAGDPAAVAEAVRLLRRREVDLVELPVRRAFHSALLEPMLPQLRAAAQAVRFTPTAVPLASSLDGELRPAGTVADPAYLCAQTRRTARWDLALTALGGTGGTLFLEIGPGTVLCGIGRRGLPGSRWLPTRPPGGGGLTPALAELHCAGIALDWHALAGGGGRVPLPAHPLHRRRYWVSTAGAAAPVAFSPKGR